MPRCHFLHRFILTRGEPTEPSDHELIAALVREDKLYLSDTEDHNPERGLVSTIGGVTLGPECTATFNGKVVRDEQGVPVDVTGYTPDQKPTFANLDHNLSLPSTIENPNELTGAITDALDHALSTQFCIQVAMSDAGH